MSVLWPSLLRIPADAGGWNRRDHLPEMRDEHQAEIAREFSPSDPACGLPLSCPSACSHQPLSRTLHAAEACAQVGFRGPSARRLLSYEGLLLSVQVDQPAEGA